MKSTPSFMMIALLGLLPTLAWAHGGIGFEGISDLKFSSYVLETVVGPDSCPATVQFQIGKDSLSSNLLPTLEHFQEGPVSIEAAGSTAATRSVEATDDSILAISEFDYLGQKVEVTDTLKLKIGRARRVESFYFIRVSRLMYKQNGIVDPSRTQVNTNICSYRGKQ